jgi:hypothetical protein
VGDAVAAAPGGVNVVDIADAVALEIDPGLPGPASLYNAASRLLEVAADALDTLVDLGLRGCPDRAYVSPGLPAFDCEQLTVHVAALAEEVTSPLNPNPATGQRHKFGRICDVTFTTTIVRDLCALTDQNTPPDPVAEDRDALQLDCDAWVIWETFYYRARAGTLLGADRCLIRRMQASHPVDPSGGVGGWLIQMQLQIDGYNPLGGS